MTVNEVSRLAGVSIRTLQYYDKIGLLHPCRHSDAGYRLYDEAALETLQQILLFRELEFPLSEIKEIIRRPDFDRSRALEQQIELLTLKKERLEGLIALAREIKEIGENKMDFKAFDKSKIDDYRARAKAQWGETEAYKEYEMKSGGRTAEKENAVNAGIMQIFGEFGKIKDASPEGDEAQALVKKLQNFITEGMYTCTKEILAGLGQMYAAGGEFTESIDAVGGEGTAQFAADAISIFCQ